MRVVSINPSILSLATNLSSPCRRLSITISATISHYKKLFIALSPGGKVVELNWIGPDAMSGFPTQKIAIKRQATLNRCTQLVVAQNRLIAQPAQLHRQFGVLDEQPQSISQLLGLFWRDQQTILALLKHILASAHAGGDTWKCAGHRFQECIRHSFPARWQNKPPGVLKETRHIQTCATKLNAFLNTQFSRQTL